MYRIRSNPHTHTEYCDGKSTALEMAEAALERGFVSLGFSSHGPQAIDPEYGMRDEAGYLRHMRDLQATYHGRLRVYVGVEADIEGTIDRAAYDYVIGAVHYVHHADSYFVVDGMSKALGEVWKTHYQGDGLSMARDYYDAVVRAVWLMKPDIVAHFDLLRKYNDADMRFFNTSDPAYQGIVKDALEAIADAGVLLEINTGGMARGYLPTPYPDCFALEHWRKLGGQVIIGSDCHQADHLDYGFDTAQALAATAGYTSVTRLAAGEGLFEQVSLDM